MVFVVVVMLIWSNQFICFVSMFVNVVVGGVVFCCVLLLICCCSFVDVITIL